MPVNEKAKRGAGRPAKGTSRISLRHIVEAGWKVVDRDGLSGLSTRALAAELNVKSPALYWHVRNKEDLLSHMIEHLLRDSLADAPEAEDWKHWLRHVARRQRELLLRHRDSGQLASIAPPTETMRTELFPNIMAPLLAAGIPSEEASAAAGAVAGLVLGWVLYEQRTETRRFVETFHNPDTGFEFAITSLIMGIAGNAHAFPGDQSAGG